MEEIILKAVVRVPTQLDLLEILSVHSPSLFTEDEHLFHSLRSGEMGEQEVIRCFKEYGRTHWSFIRNVWADVNGHFESDLMIITRAYLYVLEVKYYTGVFEYDEGIAQMDGVEIHADCVFQARRSFKNIQKLLAPLVGFQHVKGALIFAGEHNEVHIRSRVEDIQIVQRNQLLRLIQKIAEEEDAHRYHEIALAPVIKKLEQVQRANPFIMNPLTFEQMALVRPGMMCAECRCFDVDISRKFVQCRCGCTELREEAMVRTICEYGILRYDQPLRRNELAKFFGKQASLRYLNHILVHYFTMEGKGKNTSYINPARFPTN